MNEQYYVGTDLKFKLDIKSGGLDVNINDIAITLMCGNVSYDCDPNTDFKLGVDGCLYLLVDTTKFGDGVLKMIVYAHVSDNDFPDKKRTEVATMNLCKLKNL